MPRNRRHPVATREGDRVTMFEIFFDLVFVFALTRVVSFMEDSPGPRAAVQGLLLLVLLWWAWSAFIWLGNRVRLDSGYVQIGMLVAMAGLFAAALVIPQAWTPRTGSVHPALVLAIAFTVVRASYVAMFITVARDDAHLRTQLRLDVIPQSVSSALLVVGACLGDTRQTALWTCALCVDFGGGRVASRYSGWRVGSAAHFVERHGLMLIIAIGETLVAAGSGAGDATTRAPVPLAGLLGLAVAVCLWWLYFDDLAGTAERALVRASRARRPALARDAYTLGHLPLVLGVVYVALGVELLLDDLVRGVELRATTATAALCGGVALYLTSLELVRRILLGSWRPIPIAAAAGLVTIVPVATRGASALVPLGLVVATLVCVGALSRADRGGRPGCSTGAADPAAHRG